MCTRRLDISRSWNEVRFQGKASVYENGLSPSFRNCHKSFQSCHKTCLKLDAVTIYLKRGISDEWWEDLFLPSSCRDPLSFGDKKEGTGGGIQASATGTYTRFHLWVFLSPTRRAHVANFWRYKKQTLGRSPVASDRKIFGRSCNRFSGDELTLHAIHKTCSIIKWDRYRRRWRRSAPLHTKTKKKSFSVTKLHCMSRLEAYLINKFLS